MRQEFWNEAGHLIRRCHQINQALFFEEVGIADLTPVQAPALRMICENPGIDQRRLAAMIGMDEATIGKVVRRLVDRHLVERATDPNDRRAKCLTATPEGRSTWEAATPGLKALRTRLLQPLGEDEVVLLIAFLTRIVERHDPNFDEKSRADDSGPSNVP